MGGIALRRLIILAIVTQLLDISQAQRRPNVSYSSAVRRSTEILYKSSEFKSRWNNDIDTTLPIPIATTHQYSPKSCTIPAVCSHLQSYLYSFTKNNMRVAVSKNQHEAFRQPPRISRHRHRLSFIPCGHS